MTIITFSAEETKMFAAKLAKKYRNGAILGLSGPLGAGKTVFAKGFVEGLGIKEKISSPTFILIQQHKIPNSEKVFYHIDLYRLENTDNLGLEEILLNKKNIILIEWADKLKKLPEETVRVEIQVEGPYSRLISISKAPNFSEDKSSINL